MLKILVLFSLLMGAPCVFAKTADTEPGWDQTSANFEFLQLFTDVLYPCYQSPKNYWACIELVNGIGRQMDQPVQLMPRELLKYNKGLKVQVLEDHGAMLLVRVVELGDAVNGMEEFVKTMSTVNRLNREAAATLFKNRIPLGFKKIARSFLSQRNPSYSLQFAIAQGLNAMLVVHDPHGWLMPLSAYDQSMEHPEESHVGVGVFIDLNGKGQPRIRRVKGDEGFKPGDVITAVDGVPVAGFKIPEIADAVRGVEGSTVSITVKRAGKSITVAAERKTYVTPTVSAEIETQMGHRFAHIVITTFNDPQMCDKLKAVIRGLDSSVEGLVLDMRGNPGGIREQAVCAGSVFLGKKVVMSTRSVESGVLSDEVVESVGKEDAVTSLPMVTLIDGQSASAAEVLAGALQDHKRSFVVGMRSFGKGSVQKLDMFNDFPGIIFAHTVSQFFQPNGSSNQVVGITPDFKVLDTPDAKEVFEAREAELHENTIAAGGIAWTQTRGAEIARIERLIGTESRAEKMCRDRDGLDDFMVLKAQEILSAQLSSCADKL